MTLVFRWHFRFTVNCLIYRSCTLSIGGVCYKQGEKRDTFFIINYGKISFEKRRRRWKAYVKTLVHEDVECNEKVQNRIHQRDFVNTVNTNLRNIISWNQIWQERLMA